MTFSFWLFWFGLFSERSVREVCCCFEHQQQHFFFFIIKGEKVNKETLISWLITKVRLHLEQSRQKIGVIKTKTKIRKEVIRLRSYSFSFDYFVLTLSLIWQLLVLLTLPGLFNNNNNNRNLISKSHSSTVTTSPKTTTSASSSSSSNFTGSEKSAYLFTTLKSSLLTDLLINVSLANFIPCCLS